MDPFYSFLAFAVILALELMATQSWLAAYYRFGIPVYITRRPFGPDGTAREMVPSGEFAKALEDGLKNRPGVPALRFKVFPGGQSRRYDIAFHQTFFDPRSGSRYLPVTHSLARLFPDRGVLTVTGYLDWYVLFVLVYLVFSTIADRTFFFVDVVVLLIFGLSYIAQAGVNGLVAEKIQALLSQNPQTGANP